MSAGGQPVTQFPDYKTVFGLTDNPFRPTAFEAVDVDFLNDIVGDPLRLAEEPDLLPLFVPEAGPFQEWIQRFEEILFVSGYKPGGTPRRGRSLAFRVIGPQGSGKSTLTNRLVQHLRANAEPDLLVLERTVKPETIDSTLDEIRNLVQRHGGNTCCLIFDDVKSEFENQLHELYEDLRRTKAVVLFEVIGEPKTVFGTRLSSRVFAHDLETGFLTGDNAVSFLDRRIALFRAPSQNLRGEFACFPFDREEIRKVITSRDGEHQGVALRELSRILSTSIERDVFRRRGDDPVLGLSAADLDRRLIKVKSEYDQTVAATGSGV